MSVFGGAGLDCFFTYLTRWRPEDIGWSRPLLADGVATENAAELLVEDDTGVDAW